MSIGKKQENARVWREKRIFLREKWQIWRENGERKTVFAREWREKRQKWRERGARMQEKQAQKKAAIDGKSMTATSENGQSNNLFFAWHHEISCNLLTQTLLFALIPIHITLAISLSDFIMILSAAHILTDRIRQTFYLFLIHPWNQFITDKKHNEQVVFPVIHEQVVIPQCAIYQRKVLRRILIIISNDSRQRLHGYPVTVYQNKEIWSSNTRKDSQDSY